MEEGRGGKRQDVWGRRGYGVNGKHALIGEGVEPHQTFASLSAHVSRAEPGRHGHANTRTHQLPVADSRDDHVAEIMRAALAGKSSLRLSLSALHF